MATKTKQAPSTVRNKLEARIRRLGESHSDQDQIDALAEIIDIADEYRDQLVMERDG